MKGYTNNLNGRPKGVPNKVTKELRSMINDFLNDEFESVKRDFKLLEPKERLIYYEKLLHYCLPKASSSKTESETQTEQPIFETIISYEFDIEKVPYKDLKEMILQSNNHIKTKGRLSLEIPKKD